MKRLTRRIIGIAAMVLAFGALAAPSDAAAADRLQVSDDGVTWHDNLTSPLFSGLGPVVPKDGHVRTFYVRNSSTLVARASVRIANASAAGSQLPRHLRVRAILDGVSTANTLLTSPGKRGCMTTVTGPSLAPGDRQRVDIEVEFVDVEGQTAQGATAGVGLEVRLGQVGPQGRIDVCGVQAEAQPVLLGGCDEGRATVAVLGRGDGVRDCPATGTIPDTGAGDQLLQAGLFGALALLTGFWLILARRRPEPSAQPGRHAAR